MASVGLSRKDAEARLPEGLNLCCDNSSENVTIGGPSDLVDKFLKECEKDELFTRKVESCGQIFHSKTTGKVYDEVLVEFKKIGLMTKKLERSEKWISTSVEKDATEPETLGHYLADNVVKVVLFTETIRSLPNDICCIELGPHSQLLPLIKGEKGRASCVGSMKRGDVGKNINNVFVAVGELFNSGIPSKITKLFKQIQYPVSRQTLSISHLIKFDHSVPKFVYRYPEYYNTASMSRSFEIGFENPKYKSWYGHVIDGR